MKVGILVLAGLSVLFLGSCNCNEYECRGMQPIVINFENYTFDNSDHIALERYARGDNFTNRLSAFAISMSEPQYYVRNADVIIDLFRLDINSPEMYDFKIITLEDSSVAYITGLERKVVTRRSCNGLSRDEEISYSDNCPIEYMQVKGDNVTLLEDGSLLWKK